MAEFELSKYQKEIIDFFENHPGENMLIQALAGTAKTYTITQLTKNTTSSDVYLAFNNAIAEECRGKITNPKTKIYTTYALGLAIMNYNLSGNKGGGVGQTRAKEAEKAHLDNLKIYKIVDEMITTSYGRRFNWEERNFLKNNYVKLYGLARLTCSLNDERKVSQLVDDHGLFIDLENGFRAPDYNVIYAWIQEIDEESIRTFDLEKEIDFTDMLYITIKKLNSKEWQVAPWQYFTNIFLDECQDFNALQFELVKKIKRKNGRYIWTGDEHQCQPEGTKIQLIDGQVKNIEDLQFGDRIVEYSTERGGLMGVVSYGGVGNSIKKVDSNASNSHMANFVGSSSKGNPKVQYTVIDKQVFYVDKTIKITTQDGHSSSYTTNHRTYVKFNREKTQDAVCLYLMERYDGLFRIGKVHMYSSQSTLGIKARARAEGFDRCWILNIYDSNTEAWVNEQKYSLKYQIPQVIFQMEKINYTENDIENIYSSVPNMRSRAIALLEEFGRDINFPLWCKDDMNTHTARDHCFVTESCNIIPNYMEALIFDENNRDYYKSGKKEGQLRAIKVKYDMIVSVEYKYGTQKVIGITTNNYHNYVADGIVTHNSIYNFAGADAHCFGHIKNIFKPITQFELPINYRCPSSHIEYVNENFDIPIQARPNAPKGTIKTIEKSEIAKYVKTGDMIISRKNKWFAPLLLELATKGIPVYIEDKEMVESIKKLIKAQKVTGCSGLKHKFEETIDEFRNKISKIINEAQDPDSFVDINEASSKASAFTEKLDSIAFVMSLLNPYMEKKGTATVDDFLSYLNKILNTTSPKNCVRICSVHKAKGLEANVVFVLNEAKVCNDFRMSSEQREQEVNLAYISVTRAMDTLYLVKEPEE